MSAFDPFRTLGQCLSCALYRRPIAPPAFPKPVIGRECAAAERRRLLEQQSLAFIGQLIDGQREFERLQVLVDRITRGGALLRMEWQAALGEFDAAFGIADRILAAWRRTDTG